MEMTDDMLQKIVKHIIDLSIRVNALEVIVTQQCGGNPQHLDKLIQDAHEPQQYQMICDRVVKTLKDPLVPR